MNKAANGALCDAGHTVPHSLLSKCRNGFTVHAHKESAIPTLHWFFTTLTISYTELHPNWTIYLEIKD
jgi:hypothetical protein